MVLLFCSKSSHGRVTAMSSRDLYSPALLSFGPNPTSPPPLQDLVPFLLQAWH
jgi:hypothetical protein